jgi:hypothetical protein
MTGHAPTFSERLCTSAARLLLPRGRTGLAGSDSDDPSASCNNHHHQTTQLTKKKKRRGGILGREGREKETGPGGQPRHLALADGGHALVPHDQIQLLLRVHRGTGCDSTSTAATPHPRQRGFLARGASPGAREDRDEEWSPLSSVPDTPMV